MGYIVNRLVVHYAVLALVFLFSRHFLHRLRMTNDSIQKYKILLPNTIITSYTLVLYMGNIFFTIRGLQKQFGTQI